MGYEKEEDRIFVEALVDTLGYQGIGGKVSSGLGKYSALPIELPKQVQERLNQEKGSFVLLTTSLPQEEEMKTVLSDANYLLERRAGFVQSDSYAEEYVKKREQYFIKAGAVLSYRYHGDVYNVGGYGTHPVWRYGKPILMEVSE